MYESSAERWSPVQSIEKILLSVLSMLAEPNVESGANIDACVRIIFSTPEKKINALTHTYTRKCTVMTVMRMKKRSADRCKNNWACSGQNPCNFHVLVPPIRKKGTGHELPRSPRTFAFVP